MRFTYVQEDKVVGIDNDFLNFDEDCFDPTVRAIQWYDSWGEIEFVDQRQKNNEIFTSINYIESLIELFNTLKEHKKKFNLLKLEDEDKAKQDYTVEKENTQLLKKISEVETLYIFIHIPKCAGSFLTSLDLNQSLNLYTPFRKTEGFRIPHANAPTINLVKNKLPAVLTEKVKYFIVVRNPYDRMYSMWKWLRLYGKLGSRDFPEVPLEFSEFIQTWGKDYYSHYYFTQSQLNYIEGEDLNNIKVFKFEEMELVKEFIGSYGIPWSEKEVNQIIAVNYKAVYTQELIKIVQEKCLEEFETFGYSLDLI